MTPYQALLVKYHFSPKEAPAHPGKIQEIAHIVGFILPGDYRDFLLQYDGFSGFIGEAFINLWNIDEIIESNTGYGVFDSLLHTLAIGSNGGGEYIAIVYTPAKDSYQVVLSPFIDMEEEYHINIGYSFTDFLYRLDHGIGWFD